MEVNNDLKPVRARPSNGLLEVGQLARNVRLPRTDLERPVSDRDANVVQPTYHTNEHGLVQEHGNNTNERYMRTKKNTFW